MTTINVTQKLWRRIKAEADIDPVGDTTLLGPWCANLFYHDHKQFILVTNEKALLTVVLQARELRTMDEALPKAVEIVLRSYNISEVTRARLYQEHSQIQFAQDTKRQVLGSMNDFIRMAGYVMDDEPHITLMDLSFQLNEAPCSPIKMQSPKGVIVALLN